MLWANVENMRQAHDASINMIKLDSMLSKEFQQLFHSGVVVGSIVEGEMTYLKGDEYNLLTQRMDFPFSVTPAWSIRRRIVCARLVPVWLPGIWWKAMSPAFSLRLLAVSPFEIQCAVIAMNGRRFLSVQRSLVNDMSPSACYHREINEITLKKVFRLTARSCFKTIKYCLHASITNLWVFILRGTSVSCKSWWRNNMKHRKSGFSITLIDYHSISKMLLCLNTSEEQRTWSSLKMNLTRCSCSVACENEGNPASKDVSAGALGSGCEGFELVIGAGGSECMVTPGWQSASWIVENVYPLVNASCTYSRNICHPFFSASSRYVLRWLLRIWLYRFAFTVWGWYVKCNPDGNASGSLSWRSLQRKNDINLDSSRYNTAHLQWLHTLSSPLVFMKKKEHQQRYQGYLSMCQSRVGRWLELI